MTFKQYLVETFNREEAVQRAIKILERLIVKKLGKKIYRYNGPDGYQELKTPKGERVIGFLYFLPGGKAFRLNYYKPAGDSTWYVASVHVWRKFKMTLDGSDAKKADVEIDLRNKNVVQCLNAVIDVIKTVKPGEYIIETHQLDEAKRIDMESFANAALNILGKDSDLTRDEIKALAKHLDVQVPTAALKNPERRGRFNLRNASNVQTPGQEEPAQPSSGRKESMPDLSGVLLVARGAFGRFQKVNKDEVANALSKQVSSLINSPKPMPGEVKDPNTLFGHMAQLVSIVAKGGGKSLVIYGGPGIGKSYTVMQTISQAGLVRDKDWILVKGKVTTSALYETLYINRDNKLLVFDDSDSVFDNQDGVNVLKAALDSYDERIVSWLSPRTINLSNKSKEEKEEIYRMVDAQLRGDIDSDDGEDSNPKKIKFPSEFVFNSRIIFISNLAKHQFDKAILSRSFHIDMTLTAEQVFKRLESIIDHIGDPEVSREQKLEIINVLRERHALGELHNPNMRAFVIACGLVKAAVPGMDWRELLQYT